MDSPNSPAQLAPPTLTPSPPAPDDIINLQVESTRFTICTSLLTTSSTFFNAMFHGPAASSVKPPARTPDGAYIVLADPTVFKHIVSFALFETFPLFWDNGAFDLGKYAELLQHARHFGVEKLIGWIQTRGFEKAAVTTFQYQDLDLEELERIMGPSVEGIVERSYRVYVKKTDVWQCPRGISKHAGPAGWDGRTSSTCGRACTAAGGGTWETEDVPSVIVMTKTTYVRFEALLPK